MYHAIVSFHDILLNKLQVSKSWELKVFGHMKLINKKHKAFSSVVLYSITNIFMVKKSYSLLLTLIPTNSIS